MDDIQDGDEVRSRDFVGVRVDRRRYERVTFIDCDLSEIETDHATFVDCSFRRCRLNGSTHDGTAYTSCTFVDVDFFGATFTGCKLTGSTLKACELRSVTATGGAWDFMTMPRHDVTSCAFRDLRMTETDLAGLKGRGSTFVDVDLTGCDLTEADLRDADLRGSLLYSVDPLSTRLDGARVSVDQALQLASNLGLSIES